MSVDANFGSINYKGSCIWEPQDAQPVHVIPIKKFWNMTPRKNIPIKKDPFRKGHLTKDFP